MLFLCLQMGRGVGGRGRSQSEYSPRLDERERRSGWGIAPPSRHLWVGNLSTHVSQNVLSEHFLRFGDLDNISYIPGRSFAFVNFKREEDAIIAMRGLQGFNLAGMPLRIEFAKGVSYVVLCFFPVSFVFQCTKLNHLVHTYKPKSLITKGSQAIGYLTSPNSLYSTLSREEILI